MSRVVGVALALVTFAACAGTDEHVLEVTATAYNSLPDQGSGDPTLAAWGTSCGLA